MGDRGGVPAFGGQASVAGRSPSLGMTGILGKSRSPPRRASLAKPARDDTVLGCGARRSGPPQKAGPTTAKNATLKGGVYNGLEPPFEAAGQQDADAAEGRERGRRKADPSAPAGEPRNGGSG